MIDPRLNEHRTDNMLHDGVAVAVSGSLSIGLAQLFLTYPIRRVEAHEQLKGRKKTRQPRSIIQFRFNESV